MKFHIEMTTTEAIFAIKKFTFTLFVRIQISKLAIKRPPADIVTYLRISLKWYRHIGQLVPRRAEVWYRLYRSDGTGTKCPLHTLSKGAM